MKIQKDFPLAYFDREAQLSPRMVEARGIIFLKINLLIKFSCNVGLKSNNFEETFSHKAILRLTLSQNISNSNVYGGS